MFGIYDLNTCSVLGFQERLEIYKQCGFEEVALYIDDKYQENNENYVDIIKYARKIGLTIKQAHIDWKISNLVCDSSTNEYFEYVASKLDEANVLGIKYVVAHASQSDNPPIINPVQLEKFKIMMEGCSGDVILVLENVRNNTNLDTLLQLNLPNVRVCFDLGHAHCYGDENELFEKYKPQIVCSHLHNNQGKDTHDLLTNGDIDYLQFLRVLKGVSDSSNCLECFPPYNSNLSRSEFVEFVQKCYDSIKIIE